MIFSSGRRFGIPLVSTTLSSRIPGACSNYKIRIRPTSPPTMSSIEAKVWNSNRQTTLSRWNPIACSNNSTIEIFPYLDIFRTSIPEGGRGMERSRLRQCGYKYFSSPTPRYDRPTVRTSLRVVVIPLKNNDACLDTDVHPLC